MNILEQDPRTLLRCLIDCLSFSTINKKTLFSFFVNYRINIRNLFSQSKAFRWTDGKRLTSFLLLCCQCINSWTYNPIMLCNNRRVWNLNFKNLHHNQALKKNAKMINFKSCKIEIYFSTRGKQQWRLVSANSWR